MADTQHMKFDKRILRRNLQSGTVSQEEVKSFMGSLADVEANAEAVSFDGPADAPEAAAETSSEEAAEATHTPEPGSIP